MKTRLESLTETVEALRSELLELDAIDAPTDEQVARSTAALAEYDTAVADLESAARYEEKMVAVRAAIADPAAGPLPLCPALLSGSVVKGDDVTGPDCPLLLHKSILVIRYYCPLSRSILRQLLLALQSGCGPAAKDPPRLL